MTFGQFQPSTLFRVLFTGFASITSHDSNTRNLRPIVVYHVDAGLMVTLRGFSHQSLFYRCLASLLGSDPS